MTTTSRPRSRARRRAAGQAQQRLSRGAASAPTRAVAVAGAREEARHFDIGRMLRCRTNGSVLVRLLPIAPYTETSGTFVNAEGTVQIFNGVVRPLGDTRPAWKVLRVLGSLLGAPGFAAKSSSSLLRRMPVPSATRPTPKAKLSV